MLQAGAVRAGAGRRSVATHAPPRGGVVRRRALPPVGLFSDAIALNESIAAEVRPRAGPGAGAGDGGRSAGLSPSARGQVRETKDEHTLAVLLNNLASTMEKLRMPREAPAPVEALLFGQALTPLCPPRARRQRRCTSGRSSSAASTWSRTTRAWRTSVRSSRSCSRGSSPSPAGGGRESSDALGDGGGGAGGVGERGGRVWS